MTVSQKPTRQANPPGLVGLRGGGAAAEAQAWIATRLGWEDRLLELEQRAGHAPGSSAWLSEGGRRAS
jgi:hypothetical protein